MGTSLPDLLKSTLDLGGSDLHLSIGSPPQVRVDGELKRLELPDLTTTGNPEVECQTGRAIAKITMQLCNRGLLQVAPGEARVALAQAEQTTNILCDRTNSSALRSGRCEAITCDVPVPPTAPGLNITVLADPASALRECTEGKNNTSIVSNVFCSPGIR